MGIINEASHKEVDAFSRELRFNYYNEFDISSEQQKGIGISKVRLKEAYSAHLTRQGHYNYTTISYNGKKVTQVPVDAQVAADQKFPHILRKLLRQKVLYKLTAQNIFEEGPEAGTADYFILSKNATSKEEGLRQLKNALPYSALCHKASTQDVLISQHLQMDSAYLIEEEVHIKLIDKYLEQQKEFEALLIEKIMVHENFLKSKDYQSLKLALACAEEKSIYGENLSPYSYNSFNNPGQSQMPGESKSLTKKRAEFNQQAQQFQYSTYQLRDTLGKLETEAKEYVLKHPITSKVETAHMLLQKTLHEIIFHQNSLKEVAHQRKLELYKTLEPVQANPLVMTL